MMTADSRITVLVKIPLNTLIYHPQEMALDEISKAAIGSDMLMDFSQTAVGVTPENEVILEVEGDVSMHLENSEA